MVGLIHLIFFVMFVYSRGQQPSSIIQRSSNKIITLSTSCSDDVIMVTAILKEPFTGALYTRNSQETCAMTGQGSREIIFGIPKGKCGTVEINDEDNVPKYETTMYLQAHTNLQTAYDEPMHIKCIPKPIVAPPQARHFNNMSESTPPSDTLVWMELIQGSDPLGLPVSDAVVVGNLVTMVIKMKNVDGIDMKVINCSAHDGNQYETERLMDERGCTLDQAILPPLVKNVERMPGYTLMYSTFAAVKFPGRRHFQITCTVLTCNQSCPQMNCSRRTRRSDNVSRHVMDNSVIIQRVSVFNEMPVIAPAIEALDVNTLPTNAAVRTERCYSLHRLLIGIGILIAILLFALILSIYFYVKNPRRNTNRVNRHSSTLSGSKGSSLPNNGSDISTQAVI